MTLVLVAAAGFTLSTAAKDKQSRAPSQFDTAGVDVHQVVPMPGGALMVTERTPALPARPPVVVIASADAARATALAEALSSAGVASVRASNRRPEDGFHPTPLPEILPFEKEAIAHLLAALRNRSDQYPTVTVYGEGEMLERAFVAARAARADGVAYPAPAGGVQFLEGEPTPGNPRPQALPMQIAMAPDSVNAELMRIKAATHVVNSRSLELTGSDLASFAKSVPAFGRRGGPAARSAQARRSPRQVVLADVGGVRVGIEWGSPQKRGREIWGNLVKWDAVWMPGADEATTLTTNGPIVLSAPGLASLKVPAGDHTIYTLPGSGRFELIVSRDVGQFHTVHVQDLELGRIVMQRADRAATMEGLTFAIEPKDSGAVFKIIWDNREYSVQLTTDKQL